MSSPPIIPPNGPSIQATILNTQNPAIPSHNKPIQSGIQLYQQNSPQPTANSTANPAVASLVATVIDIKPTISQYNTPEFGRQYQLLLRVLQQNIWLSSEVPVNKGNRLLLLQASPSRWVLSSAEYANNALQLMTQNASKEVTHEYNTINQFAAKQFYHFLNTNSLSNDRLLDMLYKFKHQVLSVVNHSPDKTPYIQSLLMITSQIDQVLSNALTPTNLSWQRIQQSLQNSGLLLHANLSKKGVILQAQEPAQDPAGHALRKVLHADFQAQLFKLKNTLNTQISEWNAFRNHLEAQTQQNGLNSPLYPKTLMRLTEKLLNDLTLPPKGPNNTATSNSSTSIGTSTPSNNTTTLNPFFFPPTSLPNTHQTKASKDPIESLLKFFKSQIERSINRIHSNQLTTLLNNASQSTGGLDQTAVKHPQPLLWEIPLYTDGQIFPLRIMIDQEKPEQPTNQSAIMEKCWRFLLNFDLGAIGIIFVQGWLIDKALNLTFLSNTPTILKVINQNLTAITTPLQAAGIEINSDIETHLYTDIEEVLSPFSTVHHEWVKT